MNEVWQLSTPVAFLIFNRPDTTKKVFDEIRRAKPPRLLVVADGPRPGRPDESEKCAVTRAILESVDWPCDVLKNYSNVNLGCRTRVSSGLDWVFSNAEEAIILEDDCLPHPTFFRFSEELLNKYRDDVRITMISGDNFQFGRRQSLFSYYFSHFTHIWGWATWKRAWRKYDVNMSSWPEVRDGEWLRQRFENRRSVKYWENIFDKVFRGEIDTWDYQWTFSSWLQNGLSVMPSVNLISNIGFNADATHTSQDSPYNNMNTKPMIFPLVNPSDVIRDVDADRFTQEMHLSPGIFDRGIRKLNQFLNLKNHDL